MPIPSLPDYILAKVKPVSRSDSMSPGSNDTLRRNDHQRMSDHRRIEQDSRLLDLPVEVIRLISDELDARSSFALRSSCRMMAAAVLLDQRFWYRQLMQRSLFGFFTDFDIVKAVDEIYVRSRKQGKLPPSWNWREMAGLLGKSSSFELGGPLEDAPISFRVRRALWKVMEDLEDTGIG